MVRSVSADEFNATHYGESYNGSRLGCAGMGVYSSSDTTIIAVSPSYAGTWPCGTYLTVCGPVGCISAQRKDYCPGCDRLNQIDLSEAGIIAVCGSLGSCRVEVTRSE